MGFNSGLRSVSMCWLLLFFLILTTVIVGTWGQSCTSNTILPNAVTSIVTTNECQDVYTGNDFTLRYVADNVSNTLGVIYAVPNTNRWYGMGFNSKANSMPGTKALIFWANPTTGAGEVNTYSLTAEGISGVMQDDNAFTFKTKPEIEVTTDYLYLTYVVNQSPADLFTYQNYVAGQTGDVPASGNTITSSQQQHELEESIAANYKSSAVTVVTNNVDSKRRNHGILNIVGWGIMLPLGAIIARYARALDPAWFYTHAVFQVIGYAFILAGLVLGFELENNVGGVSGLDNHKALGIFLFALATLQISAAVLLRPKKDAKLRRYWNWGHWWLGRIGLVVAVANIFFGIHIASAGRSWKLAYGIILGVELLIVAVSESLLWINYSRHSDEPRLPSTAMPRREPGYDPSAPRSPSPFEVSNNSDTNTKPSI